MARKRRIQYPGAIYHVMNRGDAVTPFFQDDKDCTESNRASPWCGYFSPTRIACCLALIMFGNGCSVLSGRGDSSRSTIGVLVSREQAEAIARQYAITGGARNFELRGPDLVDNSFWRVVVQAVPQCPESDQTNVFSSLLSNQEAEYISRHDAEARLGKGHFEVQPAKFVKGPFWTVQIRSVPASPGAHSLLYISARNGEIVKVIPGM